MKEKEKDPKKDKEKDPKKDKEKETKETEKDPKKDKDKRMKEKEKDPKTKKDKDKGMKEKEKDPKTKKDNDKEAHKRKYIEEEEEAFVGDEDLDPNFNPDKEFMEPDDDIIEGEEEENTFQVEKHSHALNFSEAGEFVAWVRGELQELQRRVHKGKDMDQHYRMFVSILKDAIEKMGSYAPLEAADVDAVMKTMLDVNCTAWKKAMQGVKTGDSKSIMKTEEKRKGIIREIEDRDIPLEDDTEVIDPDQMEGEKDAQKKEIRRMLRKFWTHVSKAHEEMVCAAGELGHLVTVMEPEDYYKVVQAGTHPLIAMEIPQVKTLLAETKETQERARSREEMRNLKIEEIIIEQNLPTPLERWKGSKVMLPTWYLTVAVHYFIHSQVDEANPMTNTHVSGKFALSPSNLHQIIIGRRYAGGHEMAKMKSEDLGEKFVKVAMVKGGGTSKGKG